MTVKRESRLKAFIKSRDGFIVILVLCIMVLLFAFGGGMLIAASTTMGGVDVSAKQEQAYLTAQSMGDFVKKDMAAGGDIKQRADALTAGGQVVVEMTPDPGAELLGSATCTLTLETVNGATKLNGRIHTECRGITYDLRMSFTKQGTGDGAKWTFDNYWVD